ncbi:Unknown protein [Striga hermonthica]|uniref:DUF4219 domain-containing protein n=1 Tax=Striga hermonthica TaxID=68872 RepID=A0A9N7NKI2_STRHE|nr:Unknown protein [Striga hermonthica]
MVNNLQSFQVPILNKSNFDKWSIRVKALLVAHDMQEIVENIYEEQLNEAVLSQQHKDRLRDSRKSDKKTLFLIYQALGNDDFEKISSASTVKESWNKLQVSCKGTEQVNKKEKDERPSNNHGEYWGGGVVAKDKVDAEDVEEFEESNMGEKAEDVRLEHVTPPSLPKPSNKDSPPSSINEVVAPHGRSLHDVYEDPQR